MTPALETFRIRGCLMSSMNRLPAVVYFGRHFVDSTRHGAEAAVAAEAGRAISGYRPVMIPVVLHPADCCCLPVSRNKDPPHQRPFL